MKTMEHNNSGDFAGVCLTIILTAFTWFMNFITHTDAVLLLLLHFFQTLAAISAILVAFATLMPSFKTRLMKWLKKFI